VASCDTRRTWQVLVLGGASGVGKTMVSYRLAHHFAVGLTEMDDFHIVLRRMTTPEQQPALHFFRLHAAEVLRMDDEQMLAHMLDASEAMSGAMELVIGNHLASRAPVVLEGDFLLPSLAVRPAYDGIPAEGRVRAVFLYEEDEQQILRNYRAREGTDQPHRARVSWYHSEWLRREAERLGLPAVPARPWDTVLERVIAALQPA
jgi:2-phosphoglycerate kinase